MKKVIVFGATGGTGKNVVEQALENGLHVTVVVRNPAAFSFNHANLTVVKGDVLQPATFLHEIPGKDAVISCLGVPKIQQTALYSDGMKNIVKAMETGRVTRILCISSGAIDIPPKSSFIMTFLLKNILQRLYKPIYSDMKLMEEALTTSSLDWTVVRAPKLTDGKRTKTYRTITQQPLRSIPTISRADLADYLVSNLFNEDVFQKKIEIAY
jgi:putative NADH-flavin reductase